MRSNPETDARRQTAPMVRWLTVAGSTIFWIAGLAATAAEQSPDRPSPQRGGAARPSATRSPKVDHVVMPAGGVHAETRCSQCQRSPCHQCRQAEAHRQGHGQCQHGLCPAHCPVRPEVFGFYGTQWRRWPNSGVVQASSTEAATPAKPPKAEVPDAAEESLQAGSQPAVLPEPDATDSPEPEPQERSAKPENPVEKSRLVPPDSESIDAEPAAFMPRPRELSIAVSSTASNTAWRNFSTSGSRPVVGR